MIYPPPSRPKGRPGTGNLPVRVVFYGFFCRHGDKAPLFCFVRRMISAQAAKGGRPAGEPPLCSLWFPALPLRAVPCGAARAASASPLPRRASPPMHAVPRTRSPLHCPFGLCLAGRQKHLPQARFHGALPLHACPRRAPLPLHCPFGLCLAGRQERPPQTRSPLRPLRAVPCGAARAASRNPASMTRFPSHTRLPHRAPNLPRLPLRAVPAGRQERPPQARFHGALPSPLHVRAAPPPCVPFGLCLTGRQERPPASPLPWRASSPCMPAPRASPPALPLRAVPCGAARAASRKPASMALPLSMHARAAHTIQPGDPLPRPLCRTGSETFIPNRTSGKKRAARA